MNWLMAFHVAGHAGNQPAHRVGVEVAQLKPLELGEDVGADIVQHPLPQDVDAHGKRVPEREFQHLQRQVAQRGHQQHVVEALAGGCVQPGLQRPRPEGVVDGVALDQPEGRLRQRDQQRQQQPGPDVAQVGLQVAQHPAGQLGVERLLKSFVRLGHLVTSSLAWTAGAASAMPASSGASRSLSSR